MSQCCAQCVLGKNGWRWLKNFARETVISTVMDSDPFHFQVRQDAIMM